MRAGLGARPLALLSRLPPLLALGAGIAELLQSLASLEAGAEGRIVVEFSDGHPRNECSLLGLAALLLPPGSEAFLEL